MPGLCKQWLSALLCSGVLISAASAGVIEKAERQGVSVTFSLEHAVDSVDQNRPFRAGDQVLVQFSAEDNNHVPLSGLYPAAWIHPSEADQGESNMACINKAKAFIGGSLLSRAEIDLNVYYVLTLNQDATISVVDPLFGFGGSKLLTMLPLHATGFDWAVSTSQNQVFASLPAADEIAEIDTTNWQVKHHASDGHWKKPGLLRIEANQLYLWVLVENGVAIFEQQPFALKQLIATENKPSAIEFSANGHFAYVLSNQRLDVIDLAALSIIKSIKLDDGAVSIAYAHLAHALYIVYAQSGEIHVLDGQKQQLTQSLQSESGLGMLRFAPNGRWGFLLNPLTNRLSIIDAAKQKIVQTAQVEAQPVSVSFSDQLAYIRHAGSANLLMIGLDDIDLGRSGAAIPAADTPGGDHPPGLIDLPVGAEGIVQAPGGNAVLVSNYRDKSVYFYKEGMAAPMGQFNNYGKSPRAVLAVDHSLTEYDSPGTYSSSTVLPAAGHYQAIFFMDAPRMVHCFSFQVAEPAVTESIPQTQPLNITAEGKNVTLKTAKMTDLKFKVHAEPGEAAFQDQPFDVTIILSSGLWRQHLSVMATGEGEISVPFIPPLPGVYDFYLTPGNANSAVIKRKFSYEVVR